MVRRRGVTEGLARSTCCAVVGQLLSFKGDIDGDVWTRDSCCGRAGAESLLCDKFGRCKVNLNSPSLGPMGSRACDEPVMIDIVKLKSYYLGEGVPDR